MYRFSVPHPKMLEAEVFWIAELFHILEHLYVWNELSLECDPGLSIKFIYVSYAFYTHNLKVIFLPLPK
jgi:hypothetical protein